MSLTYLFKILSNTQTQQEDLFNSDISHQSGHMFAFLHSSQYEIILFSQAHSGTNVVKEV